MTHEIKLHKNGYSILFVIGLMLLASALPLATGSHWGTGSTYVDGVNRPGHEVPANSIITIPVDTELGGGPCDYSMELFSDTSTWYSEGNTPASIHPAPQGWGWVTPLTNANWIWQSNQAASGLHTMVRPVQIPLDAYDIEARIQFAVNDHYELFIQHGSGGVSQILDSDSSQDNSQVIIDIWTDDIVVGLNYFIFEAINLVDEAPEKGGLMYKIEIDYCRTPTPTPSSCDQNHTFVEEQFVSDLAVEYAGPITSNTQSLSWLPVSSPLWPSAAWASPTSPSTWIWAELDTNGDNVVDAMGQGNFMFRDDFTVPSNAYDFTFEFNGMADNQIISNPNGVAGSDVSIVSQASLNTPLTQYPSSIFLLPAPSSMPPAVTDHFNNQPSSTHLQIPPTASAIAPNVGGQTDLSLLVYARNRLTGSGADTAGGLAYTLDVSYCVPDWEDDPNAVQPIADSTSTWACGKGYDGGLLALSGSSTIFRQPSTFPTTTPGPWYQTAIVDGSYFDPPNPGNPTQWTMANDQWTQNNPVNAFAFGMLGNGYFPVSGESIPATSESSEWVWNGVYEKEYGLHEFSHTVSLSSLGIPGNQHITEVQSVVYFSADNQLRQVSISSPDELTDYVAYNGFPLFTDPSGNAGQYYSHADKIYRSGMAPGGGYTHADSLRPIMDSSTLQPPSPNDDLMFKFIVNNYDYPQYAQSGQMDRVFPAGLRFAILVCVNWAPPPTLSTETTCEEDQNRMYSGQNQTRIRNLERSESGQSTFELPSSSASPPYQTIPAHYNPTNWYDMVPLEWTNHESPMSGQPLSTVYTLPNQDLSYPLGYGRMTCFGGTGCTVGSTAPSVNWWAMCGAGGSYFPYSSGGCIGVRPLYQTGNANASWQMHELSTGAMPGLNDPNYDPLWGGWSTPMGLLEVRIPFTIPADSVNLTISGDIGVGGRMFAYVAPVCSSYSPNNPCIDPDSSEPMDTQYPEFTRGVSIVTQAQPDQVLVTGIPDTPPLYYPQMDSSTSGGAFFSWSDPAIQAPGDYYLKFYIETNEVGPELDVVPGGSNLQYAIHGSSTALVWSMDLDYEICETIIVSSGGGSGSGSGIPGFTTAFLVGGVMLAAVASYKRRELECEQENDDFID